jgi:hypothetical protein
MARRRAAKTVDELLAKARAALPDRPSPAEALQPARETASGPAISARKPPGGQVPQ